MKLQVHLISDGENNVYRFNSTTDSTLGHLQQQLKEQGYCLTKPLEFDVQIARVDSDFLLRGTTKFEIEQSCSRCLDNFITPFTTPFEMALHHTENTSQKAKLSEDTEDIDIVYFCGPELNLLPYVEEQFFLSLPLKPLCQEGCAGICQVCGTNKNEKTCNCIPNLDFHPFAKLKEHQ